VGRASLPHLLALLCGFALVVLVATGCGGDRSNLIPSQRAQDLVGQLDDIKAKIDAGDCDGLESKLTTFHDDATSLPGQVDSRLRKRINAGVTSLRAHAVDQCQAVAEAGTDTTPTDTTPTDTTTTETQTDTTPTETTPTEATPTDTTPSDTTPSDTTPPDSGVTPPTDTSGAGDGSGSGDGSTPADGNGGTSGDGDTP
jgi:hypothetical protein